MPPIKKYLKKDIINVAYEIVKKEGLAKLNARRIAKELGCSIQPIFHNFANMEELTNEVKKEIYFKYQEYMRRKTKNHPYKQMGLSYIQFAQDYPEFFKILFMQRTNLTAEGFMLADATCDEIIKAGQTMTSLSFEEQKKFHLKVWVFTHGIACLVATNTVQFTDEEINELLGTTVKELLKGYQRNEK